LGAFIVSGVTVNTEGFKKKLSMMLLLSMNSHALSSDYGQLGKIPPET
jgi:hypothetical protein